MINRILKDLILRLVALSRHFLFQKFYYSFENDSCKLLIHFPGIVTANHVNPMDVSVVCYLNRFYQEKLPLVVPARQDILEPGFLVKEFEPKGIQKMILGWIDFSGILPSMLKTVNAYPVKRPFRDNSRELTGRNTLRDLVNQNWKDLGNEILSGKTLFLFPEGTYTINGELNQIRQGVYLLYSQIGSLSVLPIGLNYDYLLYRKPVMDLRIGAPVQFPKDMDRVTLAQFLKTLMNSQILITPGNLFSYFLYTDEIKTGISIEKFRLQIIDIINSLKKDKKNLLSGSLLSENPERYIHTMISDAIQSKFILKNEDRIWGT